MSELRWDLPEAFSLTAFRCPDYGKRKLIGMATDASKLHSRVGDWISAAPILVSVLRDRRYYQALFDLARQEGRLVDALRAVRIPTSLRRQTAKQAAVWAEYSAWRSTFSAMKESELAQIVSPLTPDAHRTFMRHLEWIWKHRAHLHVDASSSEFLVWATRQALRPQADIQMALDLMRSGSRFNLDWAPNRIKREHHDWVQRMRLEHEAEREAELAAASDRRVEAQKALDVEVNIAPCPVAGRIGRAEFIALNSPRKLLDEGYLMHHCVGGEQFRNALRRGRAVYYHLKSGEEHSTLEIVKSRGNALIGQHYAKYNAQPHPVLQASASALLSTIRLALATPTTPPDPE